MDLAMRLPPGIAFIQWADGSIHIRYSVKDVVPLRETLLALAKTLTDQAIQKLEDEKRVEIERKKMPPSRIEKITKELNGLKEQPVELEPFDSSKFERMHVTEEQAVEMGEKLIVAATQANGKDNHDGPQVVIGKVVREFSDA